MPRPKFFRRHGSLELRVEQIGRDHWHISVFGGISKKIDQHGTEYEIPDWERSAFRAEELAKSHAIGRAKYREGADPVGSEKGWCDLSFDEEAWIRRLRELHFPGYAFLDGAHTFSDLPTFSHRSLEE